MSALAITNQPTVRAFPSDVAERARRFPARNHPAKANLWMLRAIVEEQTCPGDALLDPFAGIGSLALAALLGRHVTLVELEPHFAAGCLANARAVDPAGRSVRVLRGSARALPFQPASFDAVITSPAYGDVATRHRSREPATAVRTSIPEWARKRQDASFHVDRYGTSPDQIGNLRRDRYLMAMLQAYAECARVLRPGGRLVVITTNYWRDHRLVDLGSDTRAMCQAAGFALVDHWQRDRSRLLTTWQRLRIKQGLPVVTVEDVQVFVRSK